MSQGFSNSSGLTLPLPVNQGGTASTSASAARSALSAAVSGANNDITSLSALASAIPAAGMRAFGGSSMSAIGNTTFDLSTATGGTVTVTGLAFQPSLVLFLAGVNGTNTAAWGFDNGSSMADVHRTGTTATFGVSTTFSMSLTTSSGNAQTGVISSFTSDGFVITFTKTGTPTGTATIMYLAFK